MVRIAHMLLVRDTHKKSWAETHVVVSVTENFFFAGRIVVHHMNSSVLTLARVRSWKPSSFIHQPLLTLVLSLHMTLIFVRTKSIWRLSSPFFFCLYFFSAAVLECRRHVHAFGLNFECFFFFVLRSWNVWNAHVLQTSMAHGHVTAASSVRSICGQPSSFQWWRLCHVC